MTEPVYRFTEPQLKAYVQKWMVAATGEVLDALAPELAARNAEAAEAIAKQASQAGADYASQVWQTRVEATDHVLQQLEALRAVLLPAGMKLVTTTVVNRDRQGRMTGCVSETRQVPE